MKEQILKLRKEGKSYNQIAKILECSKSLISYYCGKNQKDKSRQRTKKLRSESKTEKVRKKTESFAYKLGYNAKNFNKGKALFNYKDVLDKFGNITNCYLTGEEINLLTDDYHFDHIIPLSKGGESNIKNLGITTPEANQAKAGLNLEDFLQLCKKILIHYGFKVTK
jgi:5-methylcytosine-specific restriction endonuclease McrA